MKCIIKALSEKEFKPRKGWWGFQDEEGARYLMRYGHTMLILHNSRVLYCFYQTITDRRGVYFAVEHYRKELKSKSIKN